MSFTVAIVGRPNVGKSTLFNRLVGKRLALTDDLPGVTRDRRSGAASLGDLQFTIIDTAGLEDSDAKSLTGRMRQQTERAVAEADAAIFLIDARAGLTPLDRHFADWLRKQGTPVILVANKCEGRLPQAGLAEAFALGLGEPIPLSAEHEDVIAFLRVGPQIENLGNRCNIFFGALPAEIAVNREASRPRAVIATQVEYELVVADANGAGRQLVLGEVEPGCARVLAGSEQHRRDVVAVGPWSNSDLHRSMVWTWVSAREDPLPRFPRRTSHALTRGATVSLPSAPTS